MATRKGVAVFPAREHYRARPSSIAARSTPWARIEGTKGVASRIALTLADSPFPAEACNTPSLAVWPCSSEVLPLFRQPPPPPPPLLAQAPPLLCRLYPILIHIRVSTATSTQGQDDAKFLVLPHRLAVFTDYECTSLEARPFTFFPPFFFSSLLFSFFFFSYATRSVKRSRDPSANCNDSSSLFLFFYSCPVPLTLSTASFHRSPVSSCTECLRSLPGILSPLPRRNWDVYPGISSSWFLERLPAPRFPNDPLTELQSFEFNANWTKGYPLRFPKNRSRFEQLVARCGYEADNEIFFVHGNPVDKKRKQEVEKSGR